MAKHLLIKADGRWALRPEIAVSYRDFSHGGISDHLATLIGLEDPLDVDSSKLNMPLGDVSCPGDEMLQPAAFSKHLQHRDYTNTTADGEVASFTSRKYRQNFNQNTTYL